MLNQNERDNKNEQDLSIENKQSQNENDAQKMNQQSYFSQQYMILLHGNQQYKINTKMIIFSQLLQFTYEDEVNQDETDGVLQFQIPQQIKINEMHVKIIQKFMKSSNFNPNRIKLSKYQSQNIEKVQAYNLKGDEQFMKDINKFIEESLALIETQILKQLISLCRYLQINSLLEVIYYHLAEKYFVSFSMKKAQQQLQKYHVKKMNEEKLTQLKIKYFDYFHKLSTQYKDIKQEKQKNREKN